MGTGLAKRLGVATTAIVLSAACTGCGGGDADPAAGGDARLITALDSDDQGSQPSIVSEAVPPDDVGDGAGEGENTADTVGEDEATAPIDLGETFRPDPGPAADDGLPASFIAVADDSFELVEVDTATGLRLRSLGSSGGDADDAGNVIDGAWWHPATGRIVVSNGPEPAAGNLNLLAPDEQLDGRQGADAWGEGRDVAISPDGQWALRTGYGVEVVSLTDPDGGRRMLATVAETSSQDVRSHPVWLRDRVGVALARSVDGGAVIDVIELGPEGAVTTVSHEMDRPVADLETRGDGKLVALYADGTADGEATPVGTRAAVLDPDSGLVEAEFDLEPGSSSLAYDATGTYLLYVDGENTVRWQGTGRSGVVAEGYVHADW